MKLAAIGMLVTLSAVAAQEFCPAQWECDGRCFQMKAGDNASPNDDDDGGFGKCHQKRNHPDECKDTDIWCPPHEIPNACPDAWECDGRCYKCPKSGKSYMCENPEEEDDMFSPPGGSKTKPGKCKNKKDHPSKCKFGKERWCPEPTNAPTASPTGAPTASPTGAPTASPTGAPIAAPPTTYVLGPLNEDSCSSEYVITSAEECEQAAADLMIVWYGTYDGTYNLPSGCLHRERIVEGLKMRSINWHRDNPTGIPADNVGSVCIEPVPIEYEFFQGPLGVIPCSMETVIPKADCEEACMALGLGLNWVGEGAWQNLAGCIYGDSGVCAFNNPSEISGTIDSSGAICRNAVM